MPLVSVLLQDADTRKCSCAPSPHRRQSDGNPHSLPLHIQVPANALTHCRKNRVQRRHAHCVDVFRCIRESGDSFVCRRGVKRSEFGVRVHEKRVLRPGYGIVITYTVSEPHQVERL